MREQGIEKMAVFAMISSIFWKGNAFFLWFPFLGGRGNVSCSLSVF
jgi:hypothetical protein